MAIRLNAKLFSLRESFQVEKNIEEEELKRQDITIFRNNSI